MPSVLESHAKQGLARELLVFHPLLFYLLSNYLLGSNCVPAAVLGRREGTAFLLTAAVGLRGRENKYLLIMKAVAV